METTRCRCSCGHVQFNVAKTPLVRLCCHCTICQDFNSAAYADILIYDGAGVEAPPEGRVAYKSYKSKSPILRGKCAKCEDPILEQSVKGPKLWIVPVSALPETAELPDPAAHIYYETRIQDVDDSLPKYTGALKSNLVMMKHLLAAKVFKGRRS
jgi:hypothetical protein